MNLRIGHGYDVHKLVNNRNFILCGIKIEWNKGLLGHSDADVGLHAIMDALLGAACLGDIGTCFSDNDNVYKDIDSKVLLKSVFNMITGEGFFISNIDCTIILQMPRINSYIYQMREIIASILCIQIDQVNIKATTEEGLGFTGDNLGVAAHAVALLYKHE